MKINEIKGLTYAQFKKEIKDIELCLNYHFKNYTITLDVLYLELNYRLFGMDTQYKDQYDVLANEGKLIFSQFQNFYFDKSKPYFVICIEYRELQDTISNIQIRLLT